MLFIIRSAMSALAILCLPTTVYAQDGTHVVRGMVVRQTHGCEIDGSCSVIIKTENGEEGVVWNQGEVMPDAACPQNTEAEKMASKLTPGQAVEMHLNLSGSRYMLCGPGASITVAP